MNGETHTSRVTMERPIEAYELDHGTTIHRQTIWRYNKILAAKGIEIIGVDRIVSDERHDHPGLKAANDYEIYFWKVLRSGVVVPHDFIAPIEKTTDAERSQAMWRYYSPFMSSPQR